MGEARCCFSVKRQEASATLEFGLNAPATPKSPTEGSVGEGKKKRRSATLSPDFGKVLISATENH